MNQCFWSKRRDRRLEVDAGRIIPTGSSLHGSLVPGQHCQQPMHFTDAEDSPDSSNALIIKELRMERERAQIVWKEYPFIYSLRFNGIKLLISTRIEA